MTDYFSCDARFSLRNFPFPFLVIFNIEKNIVDCFAFEKSNESGKFDIFLDAKFFTALSTWQLITRYKRFAIMSMSSWII